MLPLVAAAGFAYWLWRPTDPAGPTIDPESPETTPRVEKDVPQIADQPDETAPIATSLPVEVPQTPSATEPVEESSVDRLVRLIREDPERAIRESLTRAEWEALSPEEKAGTPEPIEGKAELALEIVGCDVDHPHHHDPLEVRRAVVDGRMFTAHPTQGSWKDTRERVRIRGVALNGELALTTLEMN